MRKPVKRLSGWGGGIEELDEGIKDLVVALNRAGYRTGWSCEGGTEFPLGKYNPPRIDHETQHAYIYFNYQRPTLTSEEIEDIKEIVRTHTDVPFKLVGPRKNPTIRFYGPLKLRPYTEDEILLINTDSDWDDDISNEEEL